MATSGTRTFNPQFAELMTEAYSRIQIRPLSITQEHIEDAVRSGNLTFIHFANAVQHQFQLAEVTLDLTADVAVYDLPAGALEVWSAVHRSSDGIDTPIWPMSRTDYQRIPDKDQTGRPFNYFSDRGKVGNVQRTITLWPTPDNSSDAVVLWALMRPEDVTGLPDHIGIAWEWFDAYAADLTARLAEKYAPEQHGSKLVLAERAFNSAKGSDRERAPARFRMRGYTRGRRF